MGFAMSRASSEDARKKPGTFIVVTLKIDMSQAHGQFPADASPLVYGSEPILGSWDTSKATVMEREAESMWQISFLLPANDGVLEYKYLLKLNNSLEDLVVEEGPAHILDATTAVESVVRFRHVDQDTSFLEFLSTSSTAFATSFDLANSWRWCKRTIKPDGSRNANADANVNAAATPVAISDSEHTRTPWKPVQSSSINVPPGSVRGLVSSEMALAKDRCVSIKDLVLLGPESPVTRAMNTPPLPPSPMPTKAVQTTGEIASKSTGKDLMSHGRVDHQGLYVDRGVGNSSKIIRLGSDVSVLNGDSQLDAKTEDMPEAAGAVAAAAVAERMLGPKERRQLAIILVGLPARGKTFTAAKLTRYLRWLGHETKHFNVGKYRRLKCGCNQSADFFRGDNKEGVDARNEVAKLAMEDMLAWMDHGGQVGVFDATNSTKERRKMILKMAEGKCKVIFLETICRDRAVIEKNIRLKIQQSPDYADQTDYELALADFKTRLDNYEKVYEPVDEGSYIKMIDMVSGQGGQIQVNNMSGYLPGRIVFFLVNAHITPRPILLTRHGESMYNLTGQIGGDPALSEAGQQYAKKLAEFVNERLKLEQTASIWTSTLQRTKLTAHHIVGFPKVQWRALDEINAGICDGMTYEEIKENMPEDYDARKLDKLRYRYPRGESYLDVIQRLEPVIIELERQRAPVVVIAHQAVLRSLYAYFADKPLKEIPHIEVPLHTVIEIQMGVTGVQEKRYKLMEKVND